MAGSGSFATTAIITKGLHNGPACAGIITTHFSLYCQDYTPPPPPPEKVTGGGPYPKPAWNVTPSPAEFWKPYESPLLVPVDRPYQPTTTVTIRVKLGEKSYEKIFAVPTNRRKAVVYIFNMIDSTKRTIKVAVSNFRKGLASSFVKIKNLRVKKNFNK